MKIFKDSRALKISVIYALAGVGWILLTDQLVARYFSDPARLAFAQTLKGWSYVFITAIILFALLRKDFLQSRAAEKRYQILLEQLPVVVFMDQADERQTPIYVSPRIQDLLGYSPEEWLAIERAWKQALHPEDRERVLEENYRTNETGEPFSMEYRLLRRDGSYVWIRENSALIRGEDGAPLYWQGVMADVTRQKEAEETTQRHLNELIILHAVSQAQASAESVDEIIERVTAIIGDTLYPDNCGFLLLEEEGKNLRPHPSYRGIEDEERRSFAATEGIAGKVVASGKSIVVNDVSKEAAYYETTPGVQSELCVPVVYDLQVIGVINVESRKLNAFTRDDERLLSTIAGSMATFIKKIQLLASEQKRRKEAEVLRQSAEILASSFDLNVLFENLFAALEKLVPYDSADVELLEGDDLTIAAGKNLPQEFIGQRKLFLAEDRMGWETLRRPLVIFDAQRESFLTEEERAYRLRGWTQVPLRARDVIIGFLNLHSQTAGFFTEEHAAMAQTFASQAAVAIENARLFREESRRAKIIETLANIAAEITNVSQLKPALDRIAEASLTLLNAASFAVYLLQEDNETIEVISARGDYQEQLLSRSIKIGQGVTGSVIANGKPEIIASVTSDPRHQVVPGTPEQDAGHDALISAPLILNGKPRGAINAWRARSERPFDQSELNILVGVAHQISVAIESARLFEEVRQHAQQASAIAEVGRDISATLQLERVLERIAVYAQNLLDADAGAAYLQEPGAPLLQAIAAVGVDAEEIKADPVKLGEGILGNIALQRFGEIVNDAKSDPRRIVVKGTQAPADERLMAVPIFFKKELTGLLAVWRVGGKKFQPENLYFLNSLAQQAAVAIENARLFEMEQKRRHEAELLRQAASELARPMDVPALYETIFDWLKKIVDYDSAAIMEIEEEGARVTALRNHPRRAELLGELFSVENELFTVIRKTRKPLVVEDCRRDPRFENWGETNSRGWIGVPLITRGKLIGYLTIDSFKPGAFSENDAALAQTFAFQAATSLENIRLFSETRQRLAELEIISRISFSLRAARDTREMFSILLDEIKLSLETDSAAIWMYDPKQEKLLAAAASGQFLSRKTAYKPGEGAVGGVYASGVSFISEDFFAAPSLRNHQAFSPPKDSARRKKRRRESEPIYVYGYVAPLPFKYNFFGRGYSGIITPIRTASETIGAMAAALPAPRKIADYHIRLINTLAEIAGNAIYRSQLYERSEEQVNQLTMLRELDAAIISSLDLSLTLEILAESLLAKMGADAAAIFVFNPESQILTRATLRGFRHYQEASAPIAVNDELPGSLLLRREAVFIPNISASGEARFKTLAKEKFVGYYAVPLFGKGAAKGVIEMYFRKPITLSVEWRNFMNALAGQATIAIDNAHLFQTLQRANQELSLAYDTTLEGWGRALELRDKDTEGHTRRVSELTIKLARRMGVPEFEIVHIRRGTLLHDIGKMGVPDSILRKEGKLTAKEKAEMRKHPQYAYDMLYPIAYLRPALDIPYCHHEHWDGSGYPRGLKGEEIPLPARIFAVIDVWDALRSDRPYRDAWGDKQTLKYIKDRAGKQFDSQVVEAFCKMIEEEED